MAVSLRVPEQLKKRIARLARMRATTPRALIIEAIGEKLDAEEAREALLADAKKRLARMKRTGAAIPATQVFSYLQQRARGGVAARTSGISGKPATK